VTPDEVIARADANYFDSFRTIVGAIADGDVRESGGVLIVASRLPTAWLNIAFVTRPLAAPERQLRDAVTFFDAHRLPFVVRVRQGLDPAAERAAEALGLPYADTVPGMVLRDVADAAVPEPPAGLEIRIAHDDATIADHGAVVAESFGMPIEWARAFATRELVSQPGVELYVGYVDGQPVASSALVASRGAAGVYNVGCVETHRRRGHGEAMTWHAVRRGRAWGCEIASLQASAMGQPVYERMGFRLVTGYRTFTRPAEGAEARG
jgi:GNAT superfamily N-acetyltransferase